MEREPIEHQGPAAYEPLLELDWEQAGGGTLGRGSFEMIGDDGQVFDARVGAFSLLVPQLLN